MLADSLFEGEEAVLHVRGEQMASEKRRNPWTTPSEPRSIRFWIVASEKRRNPWTPLEASQPPRTRFRHTSGPSRFRD